MGDLTYETRSFWGSKTLRLIGVYVVLPRSASLFSADFRQRQYPRVVVVVVVENANYVYYGLLDQQHLKQSHNHMFVIPNMFGASDQRHHQMLMAIADRSPAQNGNKMMAMSYVGQFEFFAIIDIRDGRFSLSHDMIVIDVVGQQTILCGCGKLFLWVLGCCWWWWGIENMRYTNAMEWIDRAKTNLTKSEVVRFGLSRR